MPQGKARMRTADVQPSTRSSGSVECQRPGALSAPASGMASSANGAVTSAIVNATAAPSLSKRAVNRHAGGPSWGALAAERVAATE
jgi:hypothetical protein